MLREGQELLEICLQVYAAAQRLRKGIAHRNHTPGARNIRQHAFRRGLGAKGQLNRAEHGPRGVLDEPLGQLAHLHVIGVGAVRLQHREFGVVGCVRTLVAEVSAQLVHRAATANHQALEVQLGGDA